MTDYDHCMDLMQALMPDLDWLRIRQDWPSFDSLDHGDNEPFALMRAALRKALADRKKLTA